MIRGRGITPREFQEMVPVELDATDEIRRPPGPPPKIPITREDREEDITRPIPVRFKPVEGHPGVMLSASPECARDKVSTDPRRVRPSVAPRVLGVQGDCVQTPRQPMERRIDRRPTTVVSIPPRNEDIPEILRAGIPPSPLQAQRPNTANPRQEPRTVVREGPAPRMNLGNREQISRRYMAYDPTNRGPG
jgi:hypothetical protein